jgi:hypothetical protein
MCIVATTSVGVQQATGFATLYWGAEVVWNIRLRGGIFFLLASAWIFSRYINAIARQGWVEQLPEEKIEEVFFLARAMYKAVLGTHYRRKEQKKQGQLAIF